ncbi:MAG: CcoQ/FixQ family Cbb3-type cytochrome c oxidase assembly chaperone [Ignavibacteria bacterium]|nr:CcoQ/FixQ family Cbb3-type cytochrome c oxidase assembly chaperone [Ignavibacteria bacterium]
MFKEIFEFAEGIEFYPIFSLIVFFVFFVIMIIWFFKADKEYISKMEKLPLENK